MRGPRSEWWQRMLGGCSTCCKCSTQGGDVAPFYIKFQESTRQLQKIMHPCWQDKQKRFSETTKTKY